MVAAAANQFVAPPALGRPVRRYHHDPYSACVLEPIATCSSPQPLLSSTTTASTSVSSHNKAVVEENEVVGGNGLPSLCSPDAMVHIGLVEFKYGALEFYLPFSVQVGEAVVTEGDRGEDLGIVRAITSLPALPPHVEVRVLRLATPRDVKQYRALCEKESEALRKMRSLAQQVKCPAYIKDVMYQLDGRKITCIIVRNVRTYVDFRRLQRVAFDVFRCRVWFAYLDEIALPRAAAGVAAFTQCGTRWRAPRGARIRS
ncbi:hypothetical protein, conserved [Trypanosoma brucei gambiense DAL972]|uniref:PSP1 C-terminal domain-containing protein n=1 Tax=Trypanosoma brucei gambiense (strain MHOM/CI/86/DAL972) TaxID=679716 RepID=C9ZYF4_TRYB9|nr:hypothetical protein, conserved [Trypanosoma brucei gambiense DAL972]CBH14453.1 hypothetical protein, conserved [Trypanosoma brucei gambiense DAL972]|eukprot:XP_011776719.1 hypothetical protein, conserved [Trypanosoma brucei gambiense DAL972]